MAAFRRAKGFCDDGRPTDERRPIIRPPVVPDSVSRVRRPRSFAVVGTRPATTRHGVSPTVPGKRVGVICDDTCIGFQSTGTRVQLRNVWDGQKKDTGKITNLIPTMYMTYSTRVLIKSIEIKQICTYKKINKQMVKYTYTGNSRL